jgi:hypothetical protein
VGNELLRTIELTELKFVATPRGWVLPEEAQPKLSNNPIFRQKVYIFSSSIRGYQNNFFIIKKL